MSQNRKKFPPFDRFIWSFWYRLIPSQLFGFNCRNLSEPSNNHSSRCTLSYGISIKLHCGAYTQSWYFVGYFWHLPPAFGLILQLYAHPASDDNILIFCPPGTAFIKPRALIQRDMTVAPSTGIKGDYWRALKQPEFWKSRSSGPENKPTRRSIWCSYCATRN